LLKYAPDIAQVIASYINCIYSK